MLHPVFQMLVEVEDDRAARFEFRLETLTLSGKSIRVIAVRGAWAGADPELAEYANLDESPKDAVISRQQAVWFISFMLEVSGMKEIDVNRISDRMIHKVTRICETLMEVSIE